MMETTRRALVTASAATAALAAVPALAREPDPDAELLAAGREWWEMNTWLTTTPIGYDPPDSWQTKHDSLVATIRAIPARTPKGAALKARLILDDQGCRVDEIEPGPPDDSWGATDLWRLMCDLEAM